MSSRAVWLCALLGAGCAQFRPPAEGGGHSGGGGGGGAAGGGGSCAAPGYAYTYADSHGTKLDGDGGGDGAPIRLRATLAQASEVYAGVGIAFTEPKGPFDASRYQGIAFTARRTPGSTGFLRVKLPDANTDPDGGACTDCYNDFGIPLQVTEEWTRFEAKFTDLVQETGWGDPRPPAVDASRLYGVQWQTAVAGATVDVEIDDVAFLGCN